MTLNGEEYSEHGISILMCCSMNALHNAVIKHQGDASYSGHKKCECFFELKMLGGHELLATTVVYKNSSGCKTNTLF